MKKFLCILISFVAVRLFALAPSPYTEGVIFSMRSTLTYSGGSLSGSGSASIIGETATASCSANFNTGEGSHAVAWLKPGKQYTGNWSFGAGGAPNTSTGISFGGDVSYIAPTGYTLYLDGVPSDLVHPSYSASINSGGSVYGSHIFTVELRPTENFQNLPAGNFTGIEIGKAISWEVGLGSLQAGQSAGRIAFREQDLTNSPASRDRLYYVAPSNNSQIIVNKDGASNQTLRQIITPQSVVDILDESGGYRIKFYDYSQAHANSPLYTFSTPDAPWRTVLVTFVSGQLKITETEGSVVRVSTLDVAVVSGNNNWTIQQGDGTTVLRTVTHTNTVPASGQRDDVVVVRTGGTGGTIVQKTKYHYEVQDALNGWGEELVQVAADPDTANLTTTYTYNSTYSASGNYLKVKSVTGPTGGWTSYAYYDDWDKRGQLSLETRPYVDTPSTVATAALSVGNSASHSYVADYSGRYRIESARVNNTTNIQTGSAATSPTLRQYRNGLYYTIYTVDDSASSTLTQRTISEVIDGDQAANYAGQPYTIKRPDQSQDSYGYYLGTYSGTTFTVSGSGTYFRSNVWHGSTNSNGATALTSYDSQTISSVYLVPNQSTMDVTIRDPAGSVVRTESWVYISGTSFTLLNYENFTYDVAGRLTQRVANNSATIDYHYTGGRMDYTVDQTGTRTESTYDGLGRVATSIKRGVTATGATAGDITTTYTYDGASNITQTQTAGGSGGTLQTLTSTAQYDLAGRNTQQVQYSGSTYSLTTGYVYTSGGRIVTANLPGGTATKVSETYLDGQMKQISGSGVVAQNYSYSIESSGRRICSSYPGGNTAMWTNSYFDWLGRPSQEEKPGWNGTAVDSYSYYNSYGQLWKQVQPGTKPTLFEYDTFGRKTAQGLDVDGNDVLDRGSDDRITLYSHVIYSWDSGASWWNLGQTYVYATSGSPTTTCIQTTINRLNLSSGDLAQSVTYDAHSNSTTQTTSVNRSSKLVTTTTDTPDSTTNATQLVYNGQLTDTTDTAGIHMAYAYDVLGRPIQSTDPRKGTSTAEYVAGCNFVYWNKDPANQFTGIYQYDSAGRLIVVTVPNPLYGIGGDTRSGLSTRYDYNDRNQKTHEWGERASPAEYVYDSQGRQTGMNTYASSTATFTGNTWPTTPNNPQNTTWTYQPATGLLSSKTDANSKSVSYTYTQAGQVYTRTWARGVVTTYGYSSTTGELTGVSYSDSTAPVTYTYNRLGQTSTVADYTGTRTFTYNLGGTLELQSEQLGSYYGDHVISRYYDTTSGVAGRYNALYVGTAANHTLYYGVGYGYDTYGRPNQVWGVTYAYTPNSNLISTVTDTWTGTPQQTQTRTYLSTSDNIDTVETKWGTTSQAKFHYGYDNLHRITSVARTSDALSDVFNRYGNTTQGLDSSYGYNDRSELTSEQTKLGGTSTVLTGRDDSYTFDFLGNRKTATHNGNTANYTLKSNGLNEYDYRDVPGIFDVAGGAPAGNTVTVNGSSSGVARHGEYYFKGYGLTNTTNPVNTTLTVYDGATTTYLPAYLAKTAEGFTYDDDGNLLSDGQWTYIYDAENRCKWMSAGSAAVSAGYPNIGFQLYYDYLGRRILKYNYQWNGSSWQYTGVQRRFLYDGYNVVYELDGSGNHMKTNVWGLDLSGTLQGAGGVGGLLGTFESSVGVWMDPAYDGQGNVVAIMNRNDGSIAGAYEYDAFGKTIRESGPYSASNPYRYSTKYTDLETGLVYYGQRYYSPSMGRFINKDPIEESGGLNLYGFCGNNGVNGYDLLGMVDPAPGSPDEVIAFNGGHFKRSYVDEILAEQDHYREGTMLPMGGFLDSSFVEDPNLYNDEFASKEQQRYQQQLALDKANQTLTPKNVAAANQTLAQAGYKVQKSTNGDGTNALTIIDSNGNTVVNGYVDIDSGFWVNSAPSNGADANGPRFDENKAGAYQGQLLTKNQIAGLMASNRPLTAAEQQQIVASEKTLIIQAARDWNLTSPSWSLNNQCVEQRNALKSALAKAGLDSVWSFTDLGGSKFETFGLHWMKHNVLELNPIPNGTGFQPFVLDPFKNVGSNSTNVTVGSVQQFRTNYPYDYKGGL